MLTKKTKERIGGSPVVIKVYLLKFSKTFNSLTLFSHNKAKHTLPKGLNDKDSKNKQSKYNR